MKTKYYIASFPYPDWSSLTNDDSNLIKHPYCLSWYEINNNRVSAYSFKCDKAKDFLSRIFPEILLIDGDSYKVLPPFGLPRDVVLFYDKKSNYKTIKSETEEYFIDLKKVGHLLKRGLQPSVEIKKPFFVTQKNKLPIDYDFINKCTENDLPVLITSYFTPGIGETLVLFEEQLKEEIKRTCYDMDIEFIYTENIDDLPNRD